MSTINRLSETMERNREITRAYSRYLNYCPRVITPDMVEDLVRACSVDVHEAYLSLFAAVLGWETDENPAHRALERDYLRPGLHLLDPAVYQNDPYCQSVKFPRQKLGRWELKESSYAPYEPFVCNHPVCTEAFLEIPQIGYFTKEFPFPAVLENGVEWMTVTPNEIETMRTPIANSHGRVLTLGLGLGYFAFSAAQKDTVESVTVIERDPAVIELFQTHLLPQFPHREKIRVTQADAFDYLSACSPDDFDTLFADLWHDQSDGLDMYLRLKRIERQKGFSNVDYWIEPTLLSSLRHMVFNRLCDENSPLQLQGIDPKELLSDTFLRRLAPDVTKV